MTMDLSTYATIVFDCDGVVLNSNSIKTDAFYKATMPWGEAAANAFVDFHVSNGGISRYKKFKYFLDSIAPKHALNMFAGKRGPIIEELLNTYAEQVRAGLMTCAIADGLQELRAATRNATWLIVSGGDQAELREIFHLRGLDHFFNGGIFGSPDSKDWILKREIAFGLIRNPAIFLGDSRYDYKTSRQVGLDFIFISGWSDVVDWPLFLRDNNLLHVKTLADLNPTMKT